MCDFVLFIDNDSEPPLTHRKANSEAGHFGILPEQNSTRQAEVRPAENLKDSRLACFMVVKSRSVAAMVGRLAKKTAGDVYDGGAIGLPRLGLMTNSMIETCVAAASYGVTHYTIVNGVCRGMLLS